MLRQVARGVNRLHSPPRLWSCSSSLSCTLNGVLQQDQQQLAAALTDCLSSSAPEAAASGVVEGLSSQHRAILLQALGNEAANTPESYVDKLFQEADTQGPFHQLDK